MSGREVLPEIAMSGLISLGSGESAPESDFAAEINRRINTKTHPMADA